MKKIVLSCLFIPMILSVSGCSSDYVISTNDGHIITTNGKPKKDKETGLISYKDIDGSIHQLHQQDIKEIVEK